VINGIAALVSLALGLAIGLGITWGLWPVPFANAEPGDLRLAHKEDLVRLISAEYALEGDAAHAKQQLAQLQLGDPLQTIDALIQKDSFQSSATNTLARLRRVIAPPPTPTATAEATPTRAGVTPTIIYIVATPVTVVPSYRIVERTMLTCADEPEVAHLRFWVRDAAGRDLPNVGIEIRGDAERGVETVYTGLKPERGLGYADFEAAPGTYSIAVLYSQGDAVPPLVIGAPPANCRNDHGATPRGWQVVLQQN
jgi:hypothetical protein